MLSKRYEIKDSEQNKIIKKRQTSLARKYHNRRICHCRRRFVGSLAENENEHDIIINSNNNKIILTPPY